MHLIVSTMILYYVALTDNHLKYLSKLDMKKLLKCNVLRVFGPPRLAPYLQGCRIMYETNMQAG